MMKLTASLLVFLFVASANAALPECAETLKRQSSSVSFERDKQVASCLETYSLKRDFSDEALKQCLQVADFSSSERISEMRAGCLSHLRGGPNLNRCLEVARTINTTQQLMTEFVGAPTRMRASLGNYRELSLFNCAAYFENELSIEQCNALTTDIENGLLKSNFGRLCSGISRRARMNLRSKPVRSAN